MLYEIEQAVFERFPGYARMVVVAEGVDNTREIQIGRASCRERV